jgi:DNA-binding response OmpR family regulator
MSAEKIWVLEFDAPDMRQPHQVTFQSEVIIGRGGPGVEVGLDLGPYDGLEKGVSRQHIRISATGEDLFIQDLDAANGTRLNGKSLRPGKTYRIANDDKLMLGQMELRLRVIGSPTTDHVIPLQTDIAISDVPPGNGELVLIVEDHVEIAQLFSMMLQRQGFVTQVTRNGAQALEFIRTHPPHAMVLDLMLPDMNGSDIARQIRMDSTYDAIPIIVASAKPGDSVKATLRSAGVDLFLQKPVNGAELGSVIAEFMRRRGTSTNLQRAANLKSPDATMALDEARVNLPQSPASVSEDTVALIVAGYTDNPLTISVGRPMTLGRAEGNPAKHVNLGPFDAKGKGVSRMHAVMAFSDGVFYVEDQSSVNGTFLSGKQIPPHEPQPLFSGQELRLGRLSMFVYFLVEELKGVQADHVRTGNLPQETGMLDDDSMGRWGAYDDPDKTIPNNDVYYSPNEFFAAPSSNPEEHDDFTDDEADE